MFGRPPLPPPIRRRLRRRRVVLNLKPDGERSFEGVVIEMDADGYMLIGSVTAELFYHEPDGTTQVTGDVYIERDVVLFVQSLERRQGTGPAGPVPRST